ncbi:ferritin family protein [Desulfogranum mediterraneum]|uniref:ferritin family protein n=1 Tax=Desulfogranum mediterraneum TaxID=160661 RepID=UPI0003FEEE45|nr:ferritin family protein [Desulfogranum mediterraneum]
MTTQEYLDLYQPDPDNLDHTLSLAMAIETQALDLYLRAGDQAREPGSQTIFYRIAEQERTHIKHLANLIQEQTHDPDHGPTPG